jgi:hypothetical protein
MGVHSLCAEPPIAFVRLLRFYENQHPLFQVQMHERCRVPLLKIVSLDAMFPKLRVTKPKLIFAHVMHFVAPIADLNSTGCRDPMTGCGCVRLAVPDALRTGRSRSRAWAASSTRNRQERTCSHHCNDS